MAITMAWSDLDVLKWADTEAELLEKSGAVCKDLTSQSYDISQVVERLGPLLTAKEVESRRKALLFLSEVLSQLPGDHLQDFQLKFILTFYNDRLKDHHSLLPHLLSGITAISSMSQVPEEDLLRLLFTILSGTVITCQSQQREERSRIFDLIILCSDKYFDTLTKRRMDFIQGVINAVEGERDPRNLLKLFNFMPTFVQKYPLEHWADEMFEVFACYYPIDFYPSPNDPNAITRDLLAEKLDNCLLGCKEFIEPAIVLALEKLETQLKVAKIDSLAMLRNCALKFGCTEIEDKFESIWMGLKQELLPGQNDDVVKAALSTLAVIVREAKDEKLCTNILTVAFDSIAISLCDINLRLFYPAVRVADAMGTASAEAAVFIIDKVAPIFLRQLKNSEEENEEKVKTILGLLKDLVAIANEKNCLSLVNQEVLGEVETVFVDTLSREDEEDKKFLGYSGLIEICQETKPETRKIIYASLLIGLRSGRSSKIPVNLCVLRMAKHFEEEILSEFVSPIISNKSFVNLQNCDEVFRTLCTLLSCLKMDSGEIYKFLLEYIFLFPDTTLNLNDEMEGDEHGQILLVLLTALNDLLKTKTNHHVATTLYKTHKLLDSLMESRSKFKGDFLLNPLSALLMHVISTQTVDQQTQEINKYLVQLSVSGNNNDLYFISGLISRCSNQVPLEGKYEQLILDLVHLSLTEGNPDRLRVCDHLLCFLFNRSYEHIESFERVLEESIQLINRSMVENGQGIRTLAWITKGLLTRGHTGAEELIVKIITGLKEPNLSSTTADAFECLAKDSQIYLPNVRMFYKQKLFDLVCKNLLTSDSPLDFVQLKAISRVLGELSPVVLRMHLAKVGPILFHCLEHQEAVTVQIALTIFSRLIESDEKFCQDHLQFLIPQFLRLSQLKGTLHIRVLSLNCLLSISKYPTYLLLPFKQDVLFSTIPALDDHKRLVRAAAVETRTRWFLIDSPIKEK